MTNPDLDPLAAFTVVLGLVLGPKLAPLAGAYAVIFLGAFAGILVGLRKRDTTSRWSAAGFCFTGMSLAVFMAVPLSEMLSRYLPGGGGTWMFFPMSLLIAAYHQIWLTRLKDAALKILDSLTKGSNAN